MRAQEFTETSCPRTRAKECSCSRVKSITEGETTVIAQCDLQHSDKVKGSILLTLLQLHSFAFVRGQLVSVNSNARIVRVFICFWALGFHQ